MIMVVDASVFILFAKAGQFQALRRLLDSYDVAISSGVLGEVAGVRARGRPGARELEEANGVWIKVQDPVQPMTGPGIPSEMSETDRQLIELATELNACLCTDDAVLRHAAERRKVKCIGSLGLIEGAVRAGLLSKDKALAIGDRFVRIGLRVESSVFENWRLRLAAWRQ